MTEHNPNLGAQALEIAGSQSEFVPEGSPFNDAQRAYLNGLFGGLHALSKGGGEAAQTPLQIYFGSQTGTAEALCKNLRKLAATKGFKASIADMNSVTPADLANAESGAEHMLFIAATCGEGDAADNAVTFMEALGADDFPALPARLNFAVLGLGDSSYVQFNQAAKDLDERLAALGATRVADLVACDLDYDDDFAGWCETVFATPAFQSAAGDAVATAPEPAKPAFDKTHPFMGTLMNATCLSAKASAKRVNHVEISLCGGGADLDYDVGDALGVWPLNDMADVDAILAVTNLADKEVVTLKTGTASLRQALFKSFDLTTLTAKAAELWGYEMQNGDHVMDALPHLTDLTAQSLIDGLRTLQPRLYSISSSPQKYPGEVHLTIGEVHYTHNGRKGKGVTSTYLGSRLQTGGAVGVYVHKAPHFHLPDDDTVPLIMIGPGTGIAPFHAFLQDRETRGVTADNWLFFGDQHAANDYLYKDALEAWDANGHLNKLSLAWSRDTDHKCYVQHLIEQDGAAFFEWLERGAAIYVCGDALRMAADVDAAIHRVVAEYGKLDADAAKAYVDALRKAHRYQRDVY
ncbi:Sulfite reductase [NADPH] flavoprotein alpha-component [Ascidiaceihabitans donghaensis]|uniref:assimilatory sulfite reductase (NADPH) n=1 Tax=Ascidiaceihabitans donghaensis TaxID=1510460 RepID=A0A2R8BCF8_9RHOB|nr:flavodoxin domain-containing protein [Ascidiaceihabitans donghaensis]SPH20754.1 Sulfite reductase [NADPH] flavoprotein alpha-component [Ascidiaceihabitans donghaensis]